jgi:Domain of unknown function (DUF6438)
MRCVVVGATALALSLVDAGCASQRASRLVAPTDSIPAVSLDRGACHGTCPIYVVRLFEDGRTVFSGERFVRVMGTDSAFVSRDAVETLRRAFLRRGFDTLPAVIGQGTALCGTYAADLPTIQLTLRLSDSVRTVRFDGGCMDHPRWLDSLATMVDSVAGSTRWIAK